MASVIWPQNTIVLTNKWGYLRNFNIITATMLAIALFALSNVSNSLAMKAHLNKQLLNQLLIAASHEGDLAQIAELLGDGADINANINGATPLSAAAHSNQLAAVQELLKREAHVNLFVGGHGSTALSIACARGNDTIIAALIDAKADVNAGMIISPLKQAVGAQKENSIKALLAAGADPLCKVSYQLTAIELAVMEQLHAELKLLLASVTSAQLNQIYTTCRVPIYQARIATTVLLLSAGANPWVKRTEPLFCEHMHKTALEIIIDYKNKYLANFLENFQATSDEINNINAGVLALIHLNPKIFNKDIRGFIKRLLIQNVTKDKMEKIKAVPEDWPAIDKKNFLDELAEADKDALQKALIINIKRALHADFVQRRPTAKPAITP